MPEVGALSRGAHSESKRWIERELNCMQRPTAAGVNGCRAEETPMAGGKCRQRGTMPGRGGAGATRFRAPYAPRRLA